MSDIYAATLDPATGKVTGTPVAVTRRMVGGSAGAVWSPDGRSLAYRALYARQNTVEPRSRLVIQSTNDSSEREIDIPNLVWAPEGWSADGRSVFVRAWAKPHAPAAEILRVDAASGAVTVHVPPEKLEGGFEPRLRGNIAFCFYGQTIIARNIDTGQTTTLVADTGGHEHWNNFDGSPDGRQLAYVSGRALKLREVGGETRELHRLQEGESWVPAFQSSGACGGVAFTPDGRYLLFSKTSKGDSSLWRVPATGGEAVSIGVTGERLVDFAVSPDGRQIVFGDLKRLDPELRVMENLLPSLPAAR
jgi:Tol biopolymer transport system component